MKIINRILKTFNSPNKDENFDWIIVGLGNPGTEYNNTRHNIGFNVLDFISKTHNITWKSDNECLVGTLKINHYNILLCKPFSFVNNSGVPVKYLKNKYDVKIDKIIVISDDINLSLGKIRIRKNGTTGGHNGLKSILKHLDSENFIRIRIGIDKPLKISTTEYVLAQFKKTEKKSLDKTIFLADQASKSIIINGISEAMQSFN